MSNHNRSWLLGWWTFTRRAVEALTTPSGDVAGCDREVECLARESWLGSLGRDVASAIGNSWRRSRSRMLVSSLVGDMTPLSSSATVRAAGWTMTVAGATALILNTARPWSSGPLTWVVPAAVGAVGVLLMAAAASVARVWGRFSRS